MSSSNSQALINGRLPPIGFWSYSRQDDQLSTGMLSRLRALLMNEIQQQFGRERIQLFQDVSAIPHGAQWEHEIRNALGNSSFFIPIVTPNFIQSEWCSTEVLEFLERERQLLEAHPGLPRHCLLFPLHLIDIAGVEPHDQRVLAALQERQWFDFTAFRHRSPDDVAVRQALSEFAGSIRKVLQTKLGSGDDAAASAAPPVAREVPSVPVQGPGPEPAKPAASKRTMPGVIAVGVAIAVLLGVLIYSQAGRAPGPPAEETGAGQAADKAEANETKEPRSLATAQGPGVSVEPAAYRWLIGGWGYGNCTSIVNIAQAPAGIGIGWGSGAPTVERVTAASETVAETPSYRFVRDQDGVQWYSGDQMLIRLVPCPNGQETP